jgi:hypothetical protein
MSFPELLLAGLIVGAGIVALDQFSSGAAWMLTVLILLIVAMRWQQFPSELAKLVSLLGVSPNQDPNFNPDPGAIGQIPLSLPGP